MSREHNDSKRTYFTFYESFFTAIDQVDISEQLPIYKAIAEYALYRKEPDLTGMGAAMWALIRPNLESNWKRWENGQKGGAPKGSSNNSNGRAGKPLYPRTNQELTKNLANPSEEIGDKEIGDKNKEIGENNKRTAKRFTPPSFDEVSEYITQKGYAINPQSFIDFYESNGWRVGKNPMKSWQAALSSWNSREGGNRASKVQTPQKAEQYDEL